MSREDNGVDDSGENGNGVEARKGYFRGVDRELQLERKWSKALKPEDRVYLKPMPPKLEEKIYDPSDKKGVYTVVDFKGDEKAVQFYDLATGEIKTRLEDGGVGVGEVRRLTKVKVPGQGLRLVLAQRRFFPVKKRQLMKGGDYEEREIVYKFYNPLMGRVEDRRVQDYIVDVSLPEDVYSSYLAYAGNLDMRERVILLLGLLVESYPPTGLAEVTGMTYSTASRIVSTLAGDGYLGTMASDFTAAGPTMVYMDGVYRQGRLLENYKVLSTKGREYYNRILERVKSQSRLQGEGTPLILEREKGTLAVGVAEKPRVIVASTPVEREEYVPELEGGEEYKAIGAGWVMPAPEKPYRMIKRPVEYPGEAKRGDVDRGGVIVATPPQKMSPGPLDSYLDIDEVVVSKGGQRVMFAGAGVEDPLSREEAEYYILDNINVWSGALRLSGDVKKKLGKIIEYHKRDVEDNVQRYSTRVGIFNYGVIPRRFAPVPLREEVKALAVEKPRRIVKSKWTSEEARRLGDAVGLSVGRGSMRWKELVKPVTGKGLMGYPSEYPVDLEEFRMGLEAEAEHADVTGGNPLKTALIVLAHLREKQNYYSKLKIFEAS